MPDSLR